MLKRKFIIFVVVFLFLIVSSINYAETTEKSGKITIWCWDINFNVPIMKDAAEKYRKDNPKVTFDVVEVGQGSLLQKLHINLSSGLTIGLPEIVLIPDHVGKKFIISYPGSFADLTDKINFSDFANYKVSAVTVDGRVYAVPFDSGVSGLFYRTDYLEKAGYKSEDLNNITWDELIEIGKNVKEKTGKDIITVDLNDKILIRIMLQSTGKWYFDDKGNVNLSNNDELKETIKTIKALANSGVVKRVNGWGEYITAINRDDVAAVPEGIWIIGCALKVNKAQSGKWRVAPTPRLNIDNSINASNDGGSSWYVIENSKNKDLAIDFLNKIYAGDIDFYQKILVERGAFGSYIPATSGSAYSSGDPFFGGQKIYIDFSRWLKEVPKVNMGTYTVDAEAAIFAFMPDICSGKISIDDALKKAEKQLKFQIE